jgi:hypothetical protein
MNSIIDNFISSPKPTEDLFSEVARLREENALLKKQQVFERYLNRHPKLNDCLIAAARDRNLDAVKIFAKWVHHRELATIAHGEIKPYEYARYIVATTGKSFHTIWENDDIVNRIAIYFENKTSTATQFTSHIREPHNKRKRTSSSQQRRNKQTEPTPVPQSTRAEPSSLNTERSPSPTLNDSNEDEQLFESSREFLPQKRAPIPNSQTHSASDITLNIPNPPSQDPTRRVTQYVRSHIAKGVANSTYSMAAQSRLKYISTTLTRDKPSDPNNPRIITNGSSSLTLLLHPT